MLQENEGRRWRGSHVRAGRGRVDQAEEARADSLADRQHKGGADRETENLRLEGEGEAEGVPADVRGTFEKSKAKYGTHARDHRLGRGEAVPVREGDQAADQPDQVQPALPVLAGEALHLRDIQEDQGVAVRGPPAQYHRGSRGAFDRGVDFVQRDREAGQGADHLADQLLDRELHEVRQRPHQQAHIRGGVLQQGHVLIML